MLRNIQPYHVYIEGALNLSVRGTTLDVRVWRWSSIETSLDQCLVFSGCDKKLNGVLRHLCALIGVLGQENLLRMVVVNEVTLPSRHRIWNSSPDGLRPSTLPLGYGGSPQYWISTSERVRNILFLWNLKARVFFKTHQHERDYARDGLTRRQTRNLHDCPKNNAQIVKTPFSLHGYYKNKSAL